MTSTISPNDIDADPVDTLTIRITPDFPGTVYTAGWTPRPNLQSPDLICPTEEHATLEVLMRRAEEDRVRAEDDGRLAEEDGYALAVVMPQPVRPPGYRGDHRMVEPDGLLLPLLALGVVGGLLMIAVQVALLQVAIRVSGAVL